MKLTGLVFVLGIGILVCVTDSVHSEDWSHFYLKAACKLMESRDLKIGNSIGIQLCMHFTFKKLLLRKKNYKVISIRRLVMNDDYVKLNFNYRFNHHVKI